MFNIFITRNFRLGSGTTDHAMHIHAFRFFTVSLLFCLITPLPGQADQIPIYEEDDPVLLNRGVRLNLYFLPEGTPRDIEGSATGTREGTFVHHLRGERGRHEGRDLYLQVADAGTERPDPPSSGIGYVDSLTATYEIIATGKSVENHWLRPGAIMGFHDVQLKLETSQEDFEKFIHDMWSPTRSDALPDSKVVFLKAVSGPRSGEYSYLWLIDSEETRDYYFPASGEPSGAYTTFEKGWSWVEDEENLGKYIEPDVGDVFTDFVVVR